MLQCPMLQVVWYSLHFAMTASSSHTVAKSLHLHAWQELHPIDCALSQLLHGQHFLHDHCAKASSAVSLLARAYV